ncbi:Phospholipase A and acyltransferase 3 [Bulinus truncatus]|nr:Phospholipase A and acyltransferase 3 [Bulinus truncatus]
MSILFLIAILHIAPKLVMSGYGISNKSGVNQPETSQHMQKIEEALRHNKACLQGAKVGDMIEFPRGIYSHWGIYTGNGKVIHLTGDTNDIAFQSPSTVRIDDFWKIAGESKAMVNNFLDSEFEHLPEKYIVSNAMSKLGAEGYNLIFLNCEHFVTWCRYGKAKSRQVQTVAHTLENFGSKIKDKLTTAVSNSQSEPEKVLTMQMLKFGTVLLEKGKEFIAENSDEDLTNLNSKGNKLSNL